MGRISLSGLDQLERHLRVVCGGVDVEDHLAAGVRDDVCQRLEPGVVQRHSVDVGRDVLGHDVCDPTVPVRRIGIRAAERSENGPSPSGVISFT